MANSNFRKKQEHKLRVKMRKVKGGLVGEVDRLDAMLDSSIVQARNQ